MTLKSMTGFGAAEGGHEASGWTWTVEVRSVNGRFLKTNCKLPSAFSAWESSVERVIKEQLKRGSVTLSVQAKLQSAAGTPVVLNEEVVTAYQTMFARLDLDPSYIPRLPGVLETPDTTTTPAAEVRDALVTTVRAAIAKLSQMQAKEGQALHAALTEVAERLREQCATVATRRLEVVDAYRDKLRERLNRLLDTDVAAPAAARPIDDTTLAREVAIMADKSDITEETDRIASHLNQWHELLSKGIDVGRTLEFLAQELLREVNTIGSKSGDAQLAQTVVHMKSEVERLKEQAANVA